MRFQSTLPVWGATGQRSKARSSECYFNPRSPCGERLAAAVSILLVMAHFNPRSPCGERHTFCPALSYLFPFQSTLPVWGATVIGDFERAAHVISIHAPRVGSDSNGLVSHSLQRISIHAPRVGSDNPRLRVFSVILDISIHAPRVGSDVRGESITFGPYSISIHAPRVGSDQRHRCNPPGLPISIHAPRVGSDPTCFHCMASQ